jgi:glycosyltransferase involved in cell wall biosynthesis
MPDVLSIVMPAYNEAKTITLILDKIRMVSLPEQLGKELLIVNDCSTDATEEVVLDYQKRHPDLPIRYMKNDQNRGKGFSLRQGIQAATGAYTIIQDADLEYDPRDYTKLLQPILEGHADVVYGSRLHSSAPHRILFFWHSLGNHILTFLSNVATNLNLTDMETCYKLFRTPILQSLHLKENRFGFEPEVTAKMSRVPNVRIYEVGISYYGRTYAEGKKINWKDGFRAIYCIMKYNFFSK